ncbi:hypothetical protein H0H93_002344 [Arthromyces matolae]|nr:hypothetical protein H0H93_002344 [Arthromyces matolae]
MPDLLFEFVHCTPSEALGESTPSADSLPSKRKPGRPLGSKNKKKRVDSDASENENETRGPGRPRGSGPKQQARTKKKAMTRAREVKWKEGQPLRIPGISRTPSCQQHESSNSGASQPNSGMADSLPAPPEPPKAHNTTPVVVKRVQNLMEAEIESQDGPSNAAPPELSRNNVHVVDDVDDENLLQSFVSEGVGDDDFDGEDDDQDDEPQLGGGESGAAQSRNWRKPLPTHFLAIFEAIIKELETDRKGLQGRSRHYDAGTFWIPRKAVWFILKKQDLKPSDLFIPDFYRWDPIELLGTLTIPCPDCGCPLTRDGFVKRPRRIVDIDSCYWLIGSSYKCRKTNTGGCGAKFRSWDQRILAKLPRALAMEFPARLTWRSGLSLRAFGIVRSCIQHGMGTSEVAEMFRMQHLRRYDELRLQYLHTKISRPHLASESYEPFLPFQDDSPDGFHGFTPSGQWFRDIYDNIMEEHRDTLNQHTAMLSARVCAIDHSHKIAKHVFQVNGVPIFTALLTVTNEKGEIRVCLFVATKSHSQYVEALRKVSEDLTRYGHSQPELFYTDNMIDKVMLESIFSSLLSDVVATEKHSHLPKFSLPPSLVPQVLSSTSEINNAMHGILDDISPAGHIVVGFDSEWNLDLSPSGHITGHRPPSIVQIAYKDQISEMLASQRLPHELLSLLKDSRVVKVGRLVNGDLHQLAIATGHPPADFKGGLDLATFAKQKLLVVNGHSSLADLTAVILGQCLSKNQGECTSSTWSDQDLSAQQIEYAARDAYVSLCLYHKLLASPEPSPLPSDISDAVGKSVAILTDDHKQIAARGIISHATTCRSVDGINVTATRTVVSVHEVLIPGAIMTQHKRRSLQEMGAVPFDVVMHRTHVRLIQNSSSTSSPPSLSHPTTSSAQPSLSTTSDMSNSIPNDDIDGISVGEVINDGPTTNFPDDSSGLESNPESDASSHNLGAETLGVRNIDQDSFKTHIRSRVLKDVFHVFNMLYISRTHGLRLGFAQSLRDALLVPHPDDKARVEAWLCTKNIDWDHMLRYNSTWLWRHCRRTVPPPEDLYPLVHDVFMTWGPLKDAKTGLPLFNAAAWKTAKNILELIRNGHVSDPPNVPLYFIIGLDKNAGGLPIYRCIRGTNMVEGGVHTHLRKMLPSCGASVRHMVTCLLDFILRHNLLVGTFNSTGKKFTGHDSIWLLNEIQELEITLSTIHSSRPIELSWVNGNLYQKTSETMGLMAVPETLRRDAGLQDFVEETDGSQRHAYLARIQGTRRPILPVHTIAERKLFNRLMRESHEFQSCKTSIKMSAVKIWNRRAETDKDIYYKLEEQLTSHFKGRWQDISNSVLSISQAKPFTDPLQKRVHDPKRPTEIINVPTTEMTRNCVTEGFDSSKLPDNISDAHSPHLRVHSSHSNVQGFANANGISHQAAQATLTLSAVQASTSRAHAGRQNKERQDRSCPRCGHASGCSGRQSWYRCQYSCRDCGASSIADCVGRKSKVPTKPRCVPASSIWTELTSAAKAHINGVRKNQQLTFTGT